MSLTLSAPHSPNKANNVKKPSTQQSKGVLPAVIHAQLSGVQDSVSIALATNDSSYIQKILTLFVQDTKSIVVGGYKFPEVVKENPSAFLSALSQLKKSHLVGLTVNDIPTELKKEQSIAIFRKIILSITNCDALISALSNDTNNVLYNKIFKKSSTKEEMKDFTEMVIKGLEDLKLQRVMVWKDSVKADFSLDERLAIREIDITLLKPTIEQQKKLNTLTYNKLAEYILPALLQTYFSDGYEYAMGTDYCDVMGNDLYIRRDESDRVTAYDLTLGWISFEEKVLNAEKYIGKELKAASNYCVAMRELEGAQINEVKKKILYLDNEFWHEFMREIIKLIMEEKYTIRTKNGTEETNKIALENIYVLAYRTTQNRNPKLTLPEFLKSTLNSAIEPQAVDYSVLKQNLQVGLLNHKFI